MEFRRVLFRSATTGEYRTGTTKKKHPKFKNGIGEQGSHEMTPEHITRPKSSWTDRAQYTGSETSMESLDQDIASGTAGASSSSQKKKGDLQQQQHSLSQA